MTDWKPLRDHVNAAVRDNPLAVSLATKGIEMAAEAVVGEAIKRNLDEKWRPHVDVAIAVEADVYVGSLKVDGVFVGLTWEL